MTTIEFSIATLFLILLLPNVLAQADQEATVGILRGLLGELPSPCSDITNSVCIYCIGYVKLLPLAFFFGLFYFILSFGVRLFVKNKPGQPLVNVPSINAGIILISIALAFFILQTGAIGGALSRIAVFKEWIDGLIFLFGAVIFMLYGSRVMNYMLRSPVGGNPIVMIVIFIVTLILTGVLLSMVTAFIGGPIHLFIPLIFMILTMFFFYSVLPGFGHTFSGWIIIILFLLLFALMRGDLLGQPGFLPELLKENPAFDLSICK